VTRLVMTVVSVELRGTVTRTCPARKRTVCATLEIAVTRLNKTPTMQATLRAEPRIFLSAARSRMELRAWDWNSWTGMCALRPTVRDVDSRAWGMVEGFIFS